jgi:predicted aspartyl protease
MLESSEKRSADFQVCRAAGFQTRWPARCEADLEVGGIAGLETCATKDLALDVLLERLHWQLAPLTKLAHIILMGKVIIKIKLTNLSDLFVRRRKLSTAKPREVEVEALVDTGATGLYLKRSVIRALGLEKVESIMSQTSNGAARRVLYEPVQLEVQGRHGNFDVVDVADTVPNLVGQIPLEFLDFVVDSKKRKLIGNPEHGGQQMTEQY